MPTTPPNATVAPTRPPAATAVPTARPPVTQPTARPPTGTLPQTSAFDWALLAIGISLVMLLTGVMLLRRRMQ
ncbi:LPXTG cell wall anchor domain-containing protein [Candidatus Gracilibacteria bacterium]|nr:LPXTG cell wall anchor domain-containing protein [Candidatus Gracilibacteria bacterium]